MVTHNLDYLKYVDYVYIMKKGRVVEQGTYKEINSNPIYKELLNKYHKAEESQTSEEIEQIEALDSQELKETILVQARSKQGSKDSETSKEKKEEKAKEQEKLKAEIEDDPNLKKLVLDEDRQTGKVSLSVYKAFYNYYGGFRFFAFLCLRKSSDPFNYNCVLSSDESVARILSQLKLLSLILD